MNGRRSIPFLVVTYTATILVFAHHFFKRDEETYSNRHLGRGASHQIGSEEEIVFFIILCEGSAKNNQGGPTAANIERQLRQTAVMLKSSAALSSTTLRFHVIADSEKLYQKIVNVTSLWPAAYQSRVVFEYHDVWFPADRQEMRNMFRVCATERLFLPGMFPDLDAAIYIDTDLVFMRPPEQLWQEFRKFSEKQLSAMAPCLYHYGTKRNKVPFYGKTGLNAGIMHMNLTRMKNFPGGWTEANMAVFDNYKKMITLADQDILNILFHKYPELVYELGCEWNYRKFQCSSGKNMCPQAATEGVSVLHGNALAFVNGAEMKFQVIFEAWEQHKLGKPISHLLTGLRKDLAAVTNKTYKPSCAKISNIDNILTKELEKYVKNNEPWLP